MDTGNGSFAEIAKSVADQIRGPDDERRDKVPIFEVGETIKVRGAKFMIRSLDAFTGIVTLKLLPRNGVESLKNKVE